MKKAKILLLLAAFLITQSAFAQNWWKNAIKGEGDVVTKTLNLDEFEGVTLAFSGDVILTQGNTQSVEVRAQQNIIDNIVTKVEGKHWRIRFDRPVRNHKGVKVYITMATLKGAKVSGSGNITTQGSFNGLGDVATAVSGSGDLDLNLEARNISTRISGSGKINLGGKADAVDIAISGSGDVRAYDLSVGDCKVQISGSGDAQVNVSSDLEVRISGSGDVSYKGSPRMRSKISGSGDVNSY